jgi:DNA-binding CsgD family transcriptional regulator
MLVDITRNCHDPKILASELIKGMSPIFKTDRIHFCFSDQYNRKIDIDNYINIGIAEYSQRQYQDYYYQYSPFLSPIPPQLADELVGRIQDILSYSQWTKLRYYNEFFKPQNLHHEMMIYLRSLDKLFGAIALFRSKHEMEFSPKDVYKANLLAIPIAIALEDIKLHDHLKSEKPSQVDGRIILNQAFLIINSEYQIVYINNEARDVLKLIQALRAGNGNDRYEKKADVLGIILQDCEILKRLYSKNQTLVLQRNRVINFDKIKKTFRLRTTIVNFSQHEVDLPYFLISIDDITFETSEIEENKAGQRYNLTRREFELIQYIAEGLTNDEIARELFISKFTVQNHMQNIFKKTGAGNRTALVRLFKWTAPQMIEQVELGKSGGLVHCSPE